MTDWTYNPVRSWFEKRPKDECPHCGNYDYITVRRFDGPGFIWSALARLGFVEPGEVTEMRTSFCDNCGFSSGTLGPNDD